MKPHLLYLAFWYPPSRASGVYRAVATSRLFAESDWQVTVITCDIRYLEESVGSVDFSLLADIPDDVDVLRVPFPSGTASLDLRQLGWVSGNFPLLRRVVDDRLAPMRQFKAALAGTSEEVHNFNDPYVAWIDPVVKAGTELASRRPINHVLATGNPYASFEAARLLGGLLGVGFSVDYRDPWTIDVFTGDSDRFDRKTREAERRIVDEATCCFQVNDVIAETYRSLFPEYADKQRVAYNGYDVQSIPPPPTPATPPFRFGILGTMNHHWPIESIYEAWADLSSELPVGSKLVLGGHLGYFEHSSDLLEAYLPESSQNFEYVGPVAKAQVAKFYAEVDVVILPVPGGPLVTSGKVYEANALGKPIVCVQSVHGGAREFLADNPLAIGVDPDAASIKVAMRQAIDLARRLDAATVSRVREDATQFERNRALEPLVRGVNATLTSQG